MKIKAVILAAGKGKRMKSDVPKVLHELKGKRIIDYVISAIKKTSIPDISIVVGHKKECFSSLVNDGISLVEQKELLGSGHALMQAEKTCKGYDYILVLCGDVPFISCKTLKNLVKKHQVSKSAASVLTTIMAEPKGYGRIVKDSAGNVVKIVEEKDATAAQKTICEINSGIYCFNTEDLFCSLKKVKTNNTQKEYYLTDVIEILSTTGKKVSSTLVSDQFEIHGINTRKDLSDLSAVLNVRIIDCLRNSGVTIVDSNTTFIDEDVEIGCDTTILPFTVIESGVKIGKRCKVGPFSHLRKGTVLEDEAEIGNFVEIKKSTIKQKTKIKHLSYIGDALVGKKVNIGAGTITANYDGKTKHKTIIGDGAFIGSDTKLIAPIKVGEKAMTGAGSVVTKDVAPGSVVVGVPARKIR